MQQAIRNRAQLRARIRELETLSYQQELTLQADTGKLVDAWKPANIARRVGTGVLRHLPITVSGLLRVLAVGGAGWLTRKLVGRKTAFLGLPWVIDLGRHLVGRLFFRPREDRRPVY
jgi:hypothetical protein